MPRDEWARLAAPFPSPAVAWCVAEVDRDAGTALLEPVVSEGAVTERLNDTVGVEGWSKRLSPLEPFAVVCELELLGVRKSAVASSLGGTFDMARVSAWACGRAAALFGLEPPVRDKAWVDFDPDAGEPVYLPDAAEGDAGTPTAGAPTAGDPLAGSQGHAGTETADPAGAFTDGALTAGARGRSGSAARPEDGSQASDTRSQGQQAIDRLVERLKREGLGREAATLVVEFGGYGRTAEEARELYRRLRELLLEKGTAP